MLFLSYYTIRASLHKHMRTSFRQILPQEHTFLRTSSALSATTTLSPAASVNTKCPQKKDPQHLQQREGNIEYHKVPHYTENAALFL